jgi:hypothetical protein
MALWEAFLTEVGTALNITVGQAGLVMSLISTAIIDAVIGIATGSGIAVVAVSVLSVIAFSAIGWFPLWTGAVVAIVFGIIFANSIREQI